MLTKLVERHQDDRISFSLPSLRIGTLTREMIQEVTRTKNRGFTIAPEAGSERLRRVINKPINEDEMETTVARVFEEGGKGVKLYFMLGLPTEEYEDLDGIVNMSEKVLRQAKRYGRGGRDMTVSVSTYVPKAHTPFQWVGQIPIEEVRFRGAYLRERLKRLRVPFKQHASEMSYIEAVFSRGDRRLAPAIEAAWRAGCRFDGWEEELNVSHWNDVFAQQGIDPHFYAHRMVPTTEVLPWEHLDTGAGKDFLVLDFQRSMREKVIPDCRYGKCYNCGVCVMEAIRGKGEGLRPVAYQPEELPDGSLGWIESYTRKKRSSNVSPGRVAENNDPEPVTRNFYRIQYSKLGKMRWLSQLEIMTLLQRAIRRTGVPVSYTEGFNPHPKLSFGPALPVGTEGLGEWLDMETPLAVDPPDIERRLNPALPEGLRIRKVWEIPAGTPSLNQAMTGFAYEVWMEGAGISPAIGGPEGEIDLPDRILITRKGREDGDGTDRGKTIDVRPFIERIRWIDGDSPRLALFLKNIGGTCCRPAEAIEGVFGPRIDPVRFDRDDLRIIRTVHYTSLQGEWVPMESNLAKLSALGTFVAC
jgi:radical SAM-linked protein